MNLHQQKTNIYALKTSLAKEYEEKTTEHEEFLKEIISYYYVNMTKNQIIGARKLKVNVSNKTNDILNYADHLYNLNQENFQLIEYLLKKLEQGDEIKNTKIEII